MSRNFFTVFSLLVRLLPSSFGSSLLDAIGVEDIVNYSLNNVALASFCSKLYLYLASTANGTDGFIGQIPVRFALSNISCRANSAQEELLPTNCMLLIAFLSDC